MFARLRKLYDKLMSKLVSANFLKIQGQRTKKENSLNTFKENVFA